MTGKCTLPHTHSTAHTSCYITAGSCAVHTSESVCLCVYAWMSGTVSSVVIGYLAKACSSISSELLWHALCAQFRLSVAYSHNHGSGDLNTLKGASVHIFLSSGFGSKSFTACCCQLTALFGNADQGGSP